MGFIATAECILNAKLHQHYEFTSLIIALKKINTADITKTHLYEVFTLDAQKQRSRARSVMAAEQNISSHGNASQL